MLLYEGRATLILAETVLPFEIYIIGAFFSLEKMFLFTEMGERSD